MSDTVGRINFGPVRHFGSHLVRMFKPSPWKAKLAQIKTWKERAQRWEELADRLEAMGEDETGTHLRIMADVARLAAQELEELRSAKSRVKIARKRTRAQACIPG